LKLGAHDVYLNVAGGLRADEPAADLAAAAALVSSLTGAILPPDQVYFGEIGLSGAVRPVIHTGLRLKEAGKLGFRRAVIPQAQQVSDEDKNCGVALTTYADVTALVADTAQRSARRRERD
jgi:DNA repair protein RadA/Sms